MAAMSNLDILNALKADDFEQYQLAAINTRNAACDKVITLRAIIEYSNYCKRHCKYCGLNAENTNLERYRMSEDEIVATAEKAVLAGYCSIVLQGGEDKYYNIDRMSSIIERIAEFGVLITLSLGELPDINYKKFYESGARRYLLKHETANAELYSMLHSDGDLASRLDRLRSLKTIGYDIGSGFMVGLPQQTLEDLVEDIMLCKELKADMVGIGTFIPHDGTKLAGSPPGSAEFTLRAVALTRILMPSINIPSTTSLGVVGNDPYMALDYGADVIMRKVTPTNYRKLYQIYSAPSRQTDINAEREEIIRAVQNKGFAVR